MTGTQLSNTRLLAFLTDAASAAAIRDAVPGAVVEQGDIAAATAFLAAHPSPQALLVELPEGDATPALLDALADMVHPQCKVIATGRTDTLRFYQWLMGLGLQEYLLAPFSAAQLSAALAKSDAPAAAASHAPKIKKTIAVIGARGGVGTTTVATNLAALFAREQQLPTALLDLDAHFGSAALALDLEPGRGLRDALEKPDRVDGLFLDRVMIRPFPLLGILSAEEPLHELVAAQANAGEMLFAAMGEKAQVIVADLPRAMNPLTRHALAHADATIIVAEPHVIDLRDALRLKDLLVEQLKRPAPLLVLNREGLAGKQEVPVGEFTKHFGAAPAARLPWLPEAYAASAQGELLAEHAKLRPALAPLRALAARLSGVEAAADDAAEGSLLTRLLARKGQ